MVDTSTAAAFGKTTWALFHVLQLSEHFGIPFILLFQSFIAIFSQTSFTSLQLIFHPSCHFRLFSQAPQTASKKWSFPLLQNKQSKCKKFLSWYMHQKARTCKWCRGESTGKNSSQGEKGKVPSHYLHFFQQHRATSVLKASHGKGLPSLCMSQTLLWRKRAALKSITCNCWSTSHLSQRLCSTRVMHRMAGASLRASPSSKKSFTSKSLQQVPTVYYTDKKRCHASFLARLTWEHIINTFQLLLSQTRFESAACTPKRSLQDSLLGWEGSEQDCWSSVKQ